MTVASIDEEGSVAVGGSEDVVILRDTHIVVAAGDDDAATKDDENDEEAEDRGGRIPEEDHRLLEVEADEKQDADGDTERVAVEAGFYS